MSSIFAIIGALAFVVGLLLLGMSGGRILGRSPWPTAFAVIVLVSGLAIEMYAMVIH